MKKISITNKHWTYDELSKVKITNEMIPLSITQSSDKQVVLEGDIVFDPDIELEGFNIEDYFEDEYDDGVLDLNLLELPGKQRSIKSVQLKLSIPQTIFLEIISDNYPISMIGLTNPILVDTENGPVSIANCSGDMHIESENGPVRIRNSAGNLYAKMENGPISVEDIKGEGLHVESENGPIKMRLASFSKVKIETENGPIYYETQPVEGGDFSFVTQNGIVHLVLPLRFSFKLHAESESGRLKSKLEAKVTEEDNTFRIENLFDEDEPTIIKIDTTNGMIKLSSDSYINLDYIKAKLEQVKDSLKQTATGEEKEQVKELLNKLTQYLSRVSKSINEEKIRNKVNDAIEKMKKTIADFDFEEAKANVSSKVEDISSEIYDGLKDGLRNVKAEFDGLKYEHLNAESLKEYIHKVVNSPLIKPYLGAEKKKAEADEIAERSRLKILDMLEKGKITSEEAERLIKAISKE